VPGVPAAYTFTAIAMLNLAVGYTTMSRHHMSPGASSPPSRFAVGLGEWKRDTQIGSGSSGAVQIEVAAERLYPVLDAE
jgi:hypothetical protein